MAYNPQTLIEKFQDYQGVFSKESHENSFTGYFPGIGNAAYHSKIFSQVGLLDQDLKSGGDFEIADRIVKQTNYKIVYAHNAVVYHKHRTNLSELKEQYYRYGAGIRRLRLKHKISDLGFRIYSPLMYGIVGLPYYLLMSVKNFLLSVLGKKTWLSIIFPWLQYFTEIAFRLGYKNGIKENSQF